MSVARHPGADADRIGELIRQRRTIHEFGPERPPNALIEAAIDAARWAPNHRLTEPWHFYLLGAETATQIADLNAELIAARGDADGAEKKRRRWRAVPGWLVLTCDRSEDPEREREDYAACCCAAQNLMLYLWSAGVGVKWTTGQVLQDPRFLDLIWVDPVRERAVGMFWYGYAAEVPVTIRKPVESILVHLP
jgi:nitroreductase